MSVRRGRMKQHRCPAGSLGLGPLRHQDLRGIGDQHEASSPLSVLLALDGVPPSPLPPTGGRGTAPPAGGVSENVPAPPGPARGSDPLVSPLQALLQMARPRNVRPAQNRDRLAAQAVPGPLGEGKPVWQARSSGDIEGTARVDPANFSGEPDVGFPSYPGRATKARDRGGQINRGEVPGASPRRRALFICPFMPATL